MVQARQVQPNAIVDGEIQKVYELCGDFMQSYDDKTIRIDLRFSKIKTCTMTFKFPPDEHGFVAYPGVPAVLELKSTTLPAKLTELLAKKVLAHMEAQAK